MTSPTLPLLKLLRSVFNLHSTCSTSLPSYFLVWQYLFCNKHKAQHMLTALGLSQAFVAWCANSGCLGERHAVLQTIVASVQHG